MYAGGYEGELTRFDKRTGQNKQISPWPEITDAEGAAHLKHRFQWTAPTVISPHDPNVLYDGGEQLFKTTDGGMHWTAISPDLTRNDKSKQIAAGGAIDLDDTGTEYYDVIFTIAESPQTKGQIWVGTDDGLVQLTRDGGKTWNDVTPKDLPAWSRVSLVEASPHDPATAYVAANHYQMDDLAPYIYKTNDYGKTWAKITDGIPAEAFVRAVREDPKRRGLLYAGTEAGVFVSFNDGAHWESLRLNLPMTPVHDLVVKDNDLVLATHGRAFWILDDLSPLRQYNDEIAKSDVHLYTPAVALRLHGGGRGGGGRGGAATVGENPPTGASIYYYLKTAPKGEVSIEILDAAGKSVRKYSSLKMERISQPLDPDAERPRKEIEPTAGLNRFVWDLRYEPVPQVPGYYLFEYTRGESGPLALPGTYQVRLTAGDKTYTEPLQLKLDPRVQVSPEDLEKQFTLLRSIHRDLANVYNTVNQMLDLRTQLKGLSGRLPEGDASSAQIVRASEALDKKIQAAQDLLIDMRITSSEDSLAYPLGLDGKLSTLATTVEGTSDSAPTQPDYEVFQDLSKKLDEDLSKWGHILSSDLADFHKLTAQHNLQTIVVKPAGGR